MPKRKIEITKDGVRKGTLGNSKRFFTKRFPVRVFALADEDELKLRGKKHCGGFLVEEYGGTFNHYSAGNFKKYFEAG